jgi:hypothetical protein
MKGINIEPWSYRISPGSMACRQSGVEADPLMAKVPLMEEVEFPVLSVAVIFILQ